MKGSNEIPAKCPFLTESGGLREGTTFADLEIRANPWPYYAALRRHDPVHYDEQLDMYLISRFEDLQQVLGDPVTFSVKHGYSEQASKGFQEEWREIVTRDGGGFYEDVIMADPPEHTRIRRLMEGAFTAHRVKQLEPQMHAIAAEQIEAVADKGEADGIADIASPMTIRFICNQLGFTDIDPKKILDWSLAATAQIGRMQDREQMRENARLYAEMQAYHIRLIRERQENRTEDMISDLVYAELGDDVRPRLEFGEVVSLVRTLMVGGNDTTATGIMNLIIGLATRPEIAAALKEAVNDNRLLIRFVEELLRLEPPVHGLSRMTTREVEVGGKLLPKGAHILNLYGSANDDAEAFPNPRKFDMMRGNLGRHVSFGNGVHRCVGQALARMEVRVAAVEIARRLDDIKLVKPLEELEYFASVATRHPLTLPITFSRA